MGYSSRNVCIPVLRNVYIPVLIAVAHSLGSAEPAWTPELGGALILIVRRHFGPLDLISLISPAGRIYFPPILWKRKLRTGEGKTIAQVLQLELAPTSQEEKASL